MTILLTDASVRAAQEAPDRRAAHLMFGLQAAAARCKVQLYMESRTALSVVDHAALLPGTRALGLLWAWANRGGAINPADSGRLSATLAAMAPPAGISPHQAFCEVRALQVLAATPPPAYLEGLLALLAAPTGDDGRCAAVASMLRNKQINLLTNLGDQHGICKDITCDMPAWSALVTALLRDCLEDEYLTAYEFLRLLKALDQMSVSPAFILTTE